LSTVNEYFRKTFGATGDNVSVPILVETETNDKAPQFYSTNWETFDPEHFKQVKKDAKGISGMYVYDGDKEKGFDKCLKRHKLKRKVTEAI
jgi:hypothetical protein